MTILGLVACLSDLFHCRPCMDRDTPFVLYGKRAEIHPPFSATTIFGVPMREGPRSIARIYDMPKEPA